MIPRDPAEQRILKRLAKLDEDRKKRAAHTPHPFEEAHDEPSCTAPICWECHQPRDAKVHQVSE